ncbi:(2Fe-2S)-binding protein [Rhodoferax sediminis]|uniref:(2Fe-2S)-binding protein n=1 Tax=Rhodoferax sediminis TaxID=2509614 RepID=A0A515DAE4_9BURK|nr:(2Fe-2S)-binding protein [Rhodoferax sediminis]QDL37370.1 (2Fe-2S)-binding protein [Rhodoferax sediminis]
MPTLNITLAVNGQVQSHEVEARTLLVHYLRDHCGLTGSHVGCDTTQCGCCTVHLDGRAIKSCTVLAAQAQGAEITTIEGIGSVERLHPLQDAFRRHHALQCGFCTPGMVMQGIDIVRRGRGGDEAAVRHDLEGNLCRCTGYQNIVDAIMDYAGGAAGDAAVAVEGRR